MATDPRQAVIAILTEMTGAPASSMTDDTRLAEDLALKSVSRMEVSVRLQDVLGVKLTVFEILKARTVGDLVTLASRQPATSG